MHCVGAVYAEAVWSLWKRKLMSAPFSMDNNTALEVVTRLTYIAAGNTGTWFSGGAPNGGCSATSGYKNYLAADDDNGNINDGTPHMTAIFAAFNDQQIACATPAVVNSGCATVPTAQPNVTATAGANSVALSWAAVPNATKYQVFRTEGVFACDFGKVKLGETTGTTFTSSNLQAGRPYSYVVVPVGAANACMGPASACDTASPTAGGGGGGTTVYSDTFETATGWTVNPNGTDTATTGAWERGNPADTNSSGIKQLGTTVSGIERPGHRSGGRHRGRRLRPRRRRQHHPVAGDHPAGDRHPDALVLLLPRPRHQQLDRRLPAGLRGGRDHLAGLPGAGRNRKRQRRLADRHRRHQRLRRPKRAHPHRSRRRLDRQPGRSGGGRRQDRAELIPQVERSEGRPDLNGARPSTQARVRWHEWRIERGARIETWDDLDRLNR